MTRTFSSIHDLSIKEINSLFYRASFYQNSYNKSAHIQHICQGKILTNIFFDPSTRTSAVLQTAMGKLGGTTILPNLGKDSYYNDNVEDIEDILLSFEAVSDIIAIRHKHLNLEIFKNRINIPIINSMCGEDEHSLSALGRVYSLFRRFRGYENLKIGFYGAVGFSRPAKSLIQLLSILGVDVYIDSVIPECELNTNYINNHKLNTTLIHNSNLIDFAGKIDALFIIEGLLQEGLDNGSTVKYINELKTVDEYLMARMKKDIFISFGMPTKVSVNKSTVSEALREKYSNNKIIVINDWIYLTMSLITYLLHTDH